MKTRIMAMVTCWLAFVATGAMAQLNTNLLVNSGAEAGPSSDTGGSVASIPGWTASGNYTVVSYGASGGFPTLADPGPADRGNAFFAGSPGDPSVSISQTVQLGAFSTLIGSGAASFDLSGWFGGFSSQDDQAVLQLSFLDDSAVLGGFSIGGVSAADRSNATGFLFRSTSGAVPVGATSALFTLTSTRYAGTYNDGYADNLSFAVIPEPAATACLCGAVVLMAVGVRRFVLARR